MTVQNPSAILPRGDSGPGLTGQFVVVQRICPLF